MKILQFIASEELGGAERSFLELCNELAKKHQVFALILENFPYKDELKCNIIELNSASRNNPFLYLKINKILNKIKPDIIHSHSTKATEIMYRLWKIKKFPYIATKRNSEKKSKKAKIFNKVPFCVGVSEEVTNSIDNSNKITIYNGIKQKKIVDIKKEDIFTIIAIGILQDRKGFKELIEMIKNINFQCQLWIVGDGEQKEELENLIKKLNLEKKVKLLGYREDTHILQAKSHLQVINSKREGFSRVLIEGFFYCDVVISTKVAGSVEVLDEKFLFDFGRVKEKIEDVYKNYNEYKKDFEKLKTKYQKLLTLQRVAKEYEKVYERVLNV